MSEQIQNRLQGLFRALGYLCTILIIFGLGFYFGFRVGGTNNLSQTKTEYSNSNMSSSNSATVKIESKEVPGVFFFKINSADHVCPIDYKVKGTFGTDTGNYYLENNKNYARIKPDICFASEEFARDSAGFIKKY